MPEAIDASSFDSQQGVARYPPVIEVRLAPSEPPAKSFLVRIAEVLSVLTVAAYILSGVANSVVFWSWGVSFFAIASVTDLLLSGFEMALYVGAYLVFFSYLSAFYCKTNRLAAFLRSITPHLLGFVFLAGVILSIFSRLHWIWWSKIEVHLLGRSIQSLSFFVPLVLLLIFTVGQASIIGDMAIRHGLSWLELMKTLITGGMLYVPEKPGIPAKYRGLGMSVATLIFLFGIFVVLPVISQRGYLPRPTYVVREVKGCERFSVLWLGQTSIVGRCNGNPKEVRVVGRASEKIELITLD